MKTSAYIVKLSSVESKRVVSTTRIIAPNVPSAIKLALRQYIDSLQTVEWGKDTAYTNVTIATVEPV
jgi:hypothetical protein